MRYLNNLLEHNRSFRFTFILFMVLGLTPLSPVYSRTTTLSLQQHQGYWDSDPSMTINQQLVELRGNIARLEAALEQDHQGSLPLVKTQMGMGPMGCGEGGCGQPNSTMKTEKMSGMEKGRMGMMGKMGKMGKGRMQRKAVPQSALPGFPGASHLYHIGGTEFFLDHREHITLAPPQELAINQIKEQALLTQATLDRQVEQAEQELWVLTSSDQPEIQRIETKIRQIEKLKGDQRLDFFRAVGEAAQVLTEQQRQILLGTGLPQSKAQESEQK